METLKSLFVAVPTTYYVFFTLIEIASTALIVWYAWKWNDPEVIPVTIASNEGKK